MAEPWGGPSLKACFGAEFMALPVSHSPPRGLGEWQVGPVQREQMGPAPGNPACPQGWSREPRAPTAYGSLGKVSGDRREGDLPWGGQANQEVGVVLVCPESLQNSKCWGKAGNEVK